LLAGQAVSLRASKGVLDLREALAFVLETLLNLSQVVGKSVKADLEVGTFLLSSHPGQGSRDAGGVCIHGRGGLRRGFGNSG
jgi:hypothetical protein